MAINALQPILRGATGKELQFTGDFHAYWDQLGIPPGQFAERMAAWKALPQNAAWIDATEDADAADIVGGLWRNGEQGVWYDASDLRTMFQDAAGTLPVYAPGQGQVDPPVGRILDKSGRGNHAYQATTTSRPALSARYNGLLASEKFDDVYWALTLNFSVSKTAEINDPSGGQDAWKIVSITGTGTVGKVYGSGLKNPIFTVWCKAGTFTPSILVRNGTTATNLISGSVNSSDFSNAYGKFTNTDLGGGWRRLRIEISSGIATTDNVFLYPGATGAVASGLYFYLWRADLREANDGVGLPPYQRVVDASTYDTAGFPLYLRFDGVDDGLQTASVDFSATDKVFVSAAVRKLSDTTTGTVVELSAEKNANTGVFALFAPISNGGANLAWFSKGTSESQALISGMAAPLSTVLTGIGDVAGKVSRLRGNGGVWVSSATTQGTGNYGNYPIYIGRRAGASVPFNGRLYGLLIRGGVANDAQIGKVERYLNQKARIY